jgi:hypothetical protein
MLIVTTLQTEAAKGNRNSKEGALNICSRRALGRKDSEEARSLREDETVIESSRRTVTEEKNRCSRQKRRGNGGSGESNKPTSRLLTILCKVANLLRGSQSGGNDALDSSLGS